MDDQRDYAEEAYNSWLMHGGDEEAAPTALTGYRLAHPENVVWSPERGWVNGSSLSLRQAVRLVRGYGPCEAEQPHELDTDHAEPNEFWSVVDPWQLVLHAEVYKQCAP